MSPTDQEDRRRFRRILFDAPATLILETDLHQTKLIDISLNGALVDSSDAWRVEVGQQLELSIHLGEEEPRILMQAQVAHLRAGKIGLRCLNIDMESIGHLRRLVELNLGDSELLERELDHLG